MCFIMLRRLSLILFYLLLSFTPSCGVKGRPLPPEPPRELGIGKPVYPGVDRSILPDSNVDDQKNKEDRKKR
jgi:hypothetical protein